MNSNIKKNDQLSSVLFVNTLLQNFDNTVNKYLSAVDQTIIDGLKDFFPNNLLPITPNDLSVSRTVTLVMDSNEHSHSNFYDYIMNLVLDFSTKHFNSHINQISMSFEKLDNEYDEKNNIILKYVINLTQNKDSVIDASTRINFLLKKLNV
jgi:phosphomevalonate kinase